MRAKFIGKDHSRGFRNGKIYKIRTEILKGMLTVFDINSALFCPYSKLETMLDNWEIVTNDRKEKNNNMKLINPEIQFSNECVEVNYFNEFDISKDKWGSSSNYKCSPYRIK